MTKASNITRTTVTQKYIRKENLFVCKIRTISHWSQSSRTIPDINSDIADTLNFLIFIMYD